ncbi:hypothetical protein PC118_g9918 [Phytophthora cactorum]|uniref:Uncharacterized protein n=1 Tax=Phytophthora cactorum TaxID=29920 RepID=A0A8T1FU07_9STRA|nr:hypothetical protein PC114_g11266 [Phytophthora cactorum]KAG2982548.1 hypothetical protein PC118_g9918 [Phytophthora cactorum]KAG3019990.1 hypothetical protein PC120_g9540 [Phytophthora cactorum]KAG3064967.1 hypothetical protein PC121_g11525 [Phytophthora cactorum]
MVAELRPRATSHHRDSLAPAAPLLPRFVDASSPKSSSSLSLHRWKRLLLLGCVLYASLLLVWFGFMDVRRDSEVFGGSLSNFVSSASLDESKLSYLHAHEDRELRTDFAFAELEMEFLHQINASVERDEKAITEAEAHAKTLKSFPS